MSDDEKSSAPFRSMGPTLEGFARRVGQFVAGVSDTVTLPELVRVALAEAEAFAAQGEPREADEVLRAALIERPDDPTLLDAQTANWIEARLAAAPPFDPPSFPADDRDRCAASRALIAGIEAAENLDPARALEQVRRARRVASPGHRATRQRLHRVAHMIASDAYARLGRHRRAAHEILSARGLLDEHTSGPVRAVVLEIGAHVLLAEGRVDEADHWTAELERTADAHERPGSTPSAVTSLRARIYAVRGDHPRALELARLSPMPHTPSEAQVRVALLAAQPDIACEAALARLRAASEQVTRQRFWALSQVRAAVEDDAPLDPTVIRDVLAALRAHIMTLPPQSRGPATDEYAFVSLCVGAPGEDLAALLDGAAPVSEECVVAMLRGDAADASLREAWISPGPPARLRRHREYGGLRGPDEISPLRNGALRSRVLATHRALILAEWARARGRIEESGDRLVQALVEDPNSREAAAALGALHDVHAAHSLEDALRQATEVLSRVPSHVDGVHIAGMDAHLRSVMAARERLVRPLTIAVMGEFSSGKSSLVNALFRARVAPTGVLPTTSTINLFRRGDGHRARVHYRDGTVTMLEADQIAPFLHELNEDSAPRIRHVEIERAGEVIKNASIVDTPGLNALDPYHEQVAREFIDEADAIVWVFSATRGGAASELEMLEDLRGSGRRVLGVLNKIDTLDPSERAELSSYLRTQLKDVLADLVPLCATEAERWRTSTPPPAGEDDPFAPVEAALDDHFLRHARALKRQLAQRSLRDTMRAASRDLVATIERLETVDADTPDVDPATELHPIMRRFREAIARHLFGQDERLTREWLAGGFVHTGRATRSTSIDATFAADHLEQLMNDAVRDSLTELSREDELSLTLAALLGERFVPWADGHMAALRTTEIHAETLRAAQRAASAGEDAIRRSVRASLEPIVQAWTEKLTRMEPELREVLVERHRRTRARGRAVATRLRATHQASIEALAAVAEAWANEATPTNEETPDV